MRFCFYLNQKCQIRTTLYRAAKIPGLLNIGPLFINITRYFSTISYFSMIQSRTIKFLYRYFLFWSEDAKIEAANMHHNKQKLGHREI